MCDDDDDGKVQILVPNFRDDGRVVGDGKEKQT